MLQLVIGFLSGAVVTILVLFLGLVLWFNALPVVKKDLERKGFTPLVKPQLPQYLEEVIQNLNGPEGTQVNPETCCWFNLIVDFLFRELRDSIPMKRVLMRMINKEFEDLMMKTEGRIIEQLTLRDYCLGTSLPIIRKATVIKVDCSKDDPNVPELIDVALEIDYKGGAKMTIDADLMLNKSACVSLTVVSLRGSVRVQFTRIPYTHWSFTFYEISTVVFYGHASFPWSSNYYCQATEEPKIDLRIDSQFEGRSFPRLSTLIESQLRKLIRRKYTLPGVKMRQKPFFKRPNPQDQLLELYVNNSLVTVGLLEVQVVSCSRLALPETATSAYCTLTLDSNPYQPQMSLWRTQWPTLELMVPKDREQKIGIHYKQIIPEGSRSHLIAVKHVYAAELAAQGADIRPGDILVRINNVRVTSVRQVDRLIQRAPGNSVLVSVQRPPPHINIFASAPAQRLAVTKSEDATAQTEQPVVLERDDTDMEQCNSHANEESRISRRIDGDCISLCGVEGERGAGQEEGPRRRANTIREGRSATPEILHTQMLSDSPPRPKRSSQLGGREQDLQQRRVSHPLPPVGGVPDDLQRTKEVPACKNPTWNQDFVFNVGKEHIYLNLCLWSKVAEESCDLLIGHVTVPLMDIALECLCTSSGYHHQCYVLVAAHTLRPSVSRATLQAKLAAVHDTNKDGKQNALNFVGDVFLRFKHQPKPITESEEKSTKEAEEDTTLSEPQQFKSHPFTASEGQLPSDHCFEVVANDGPAVICNICNRRIWSLKSKLLLCKKCGLKCHKKCSKYCIKEVPCKSEDYDAPSTMSQSTEGDFTLLSFASGLGNQELVQRDKKVDSGVYYDHHHLQQRGDPAVLETSFTNSFEMLEERDGLSASQSAPPGGWDTLVVGMESSGEKEIYTPFEGSDSSSLEGSYGDQFQDMKTENPTSAHSNNSFMNEFTNILQDEINICNSKINVIAARLKTTGLSQTEECQLKIELREHEEELETLTTSMTTKLQ